MLEGKQLRLRSFEIADAEIINQQFNQLETRQFLDMPYPFSLEDMKQWIKKTWETRKNHQNYFFAIEQFDTQQLLGVCGLMHISKINRKAELMIVIYDKQYHDKGYGSEAVRLLLDFGFNQLNLHRIFLFTHDINKRAQRVYEKIGFKPGGRRRQASFFEGSYHDLLLYDMLASEFSGV
jgi:RimJ/RimL family protein N-acetyltransferase